MVLGLAMVAAIQAIALAYLALVAARERAEDRRKLLQQTARLKKSG